MRYILTAIIITMFMITPVTAQSFYHEVTIELNGDYEIKTNVRIPDASSEIDLKGVGRAFIHSKLIIMPEKEELKSWWNLF